jgi:hypothetical protein
MNMLSLSPSTSPPQGSPVVTMKYNTGDPEIDHMYNQSPIITEYAATYQNDKTEEKVSDFFSSSIFM